MAIRSTWLRTQRLRVRLAEIDAPEKRQAFGNASRLSLTVTCIGKAAAVLPTGKDRDGRVLGRVRCAGTDANAEQVRRGMAWVFERTLEVTRRYSIQAKLA
jgi:endonuclease YncB( thermonuclease family)